MSEVTIYDGNFKKKGTEKYGVDLGEDAVSVACVHQVVKAILAGKRQGTGSSKNRSAVRGGGAKPFKQKGTGNARRGSSRSPLLVGGGAAFGPTPRSFKQKINKKMMNRAVQSVLADKLKENCLYVVEGFKSDGKTKAMNELLKKNELLSSLVVSNELDAAEVKATRNIKTCGATSVNFFDVYSALKYKNLIIEKSAFEQLVKRLEK